MEHTEKKIKEKSLFELIKSEKESFFTEIILENINDGIVVTDKNDVIIYTNRKMSEISGLKKEQIIGVRILGDFSRETLKDFSPHYLKAKNSCRQISYDAIFVITPSGRETYQSGCLVPLIKNGRFDGMVCTIQDVTSYKETEEKLKKAGDELELKIKESTSELLKSNKKLKREIRERKRAEEALRKSEETLRDFFDNSSLGIFRSTPEGKLIQVNRSYARIFGYQDPDDVIKSMNDIAKSIYADPPERKEIVDFVRKNPGMFKFENRYLKKDGSAFTANLYLRLARDEKGHELYLEGFVEDISELKRSQEERILMERRLTYSQKMESIGTLAGGIAHNFNNMLGAMMGYTELSLDDVDKNTHLWDNLHKLLIIIHRMKDMVKQLLTFSNRHKEEKMPIKPDFIIKQALNLLKISLPSSIKLIEEYKDVKCRIMADPYQLHQLILNLVSNSVYAMKEKGGTLEVKLTEEVLSEENIELQEEVSPGEYVKITVRDTGKGMERKIMERIFEPYFTTKYPGEGTGLGLAMVHGIIRNHNGFIRVESEPGMGTVFYVYIPVIKDEIEKEKGNPPVKKTKERILFVDDEKDIADIGRQMLSRMGYDVFVTTSSEEALEVFRKRSEEFSLVITDKTMPEMTGEILAEKISSIRKDIPIILSSGHNLPGISLEEKKKGIRAFIMKPFEKEKLAEVVRSVLEEVGPE